MPTSITLNDGTVLPSLAFGTGTAIYGKDATAQVVQAIKAGFVHIDCAEAYANEETVGQAIKECGLPRDKLFITTKCMSDDATKSCEASLKKLGLDYVDLFLIHSPIKRDIPALWKQLEELKKSGKARSIGVSNFRIMDLEKVLAVATVKPSINQIEFHPYVLASLLPLLDFHAKHDIHLAAYGPLTPIFRVPGGAVDAVVSHIAKSKGEGVTEGQVLLKWAMQRGGGEVVTTSTKMDRLKEQLEVLKMEDLTKHEVEILDQAGATQHYRHFMKHMDTDEE